MYPVNSKAPGPSAVIGTEVPVVSSCSETNCDPLTSLAIHFPIFRIAIPVRILIIWKAAAVFGLGDLGRKLSKTQA